MINTKEIEIKDYDYELPSENIALHPLPQRDESRLLVYKDDKIQESAFKNISEFIPDDSILIFNDSKVVKARIIIENSKRQKIEIFCLEPILPSKDFQVTFSAVKKCRWLCMIGNAKKWKEDVIIHNFVTKGKVIELRAKKSSPVNGVYEVDFEWNPIEFSFSEVLTLVGHIPLPPYIKRADQRSDAERYQTVYANLEGSVAAPTAGLHFTNEVLEELKAKGVDEEFVTLHVGAGTFQPVKHEKIGNHDMHGEIFFVTKALIEKLLNNKEKKIIAAGTTSARTIESLYWLGLKLKENSSVKPENLKVSQWEAYENESSGKHNMKDALNALYEYMKFNELNSLQCETQIIIAPGYEFKIIEGLITNFHQPKSTLLLLIAAFTKGNWKKIYEYALRHNFRFLSYGDSSLLLNF
ncbi:MAG: S-adenosylmethionine:tRNA ribosyltransferase-isomerase [Ignavibacteria bacterium]|nr:S-adenosylmethionine:tRNA ribosyltransferase-isomerase [Ignavibacteria bacterium]